MNVPVHNIKQILKALLDINWVDMAIIIDV